MSNKRKVFESVLSGRSDANIDFNDLCRLATALGFQARPPKGSHHIFAHPNISEIINIQSRGRQAKPYQVKQVVLTHFQGGTRAPRAFVSVHGVPAPPHKAKMRQHQTSPWLDSSL